MRGAHHRRRRAIAIAVLAGLVVAGGAPGPAAQTPDGWTLPRTPDGRPDLQGVWVADSATPLERPSALAGRDRLTDDEVATLQARADAIFRDGRSAFAAGDAAFYAALDNVDTYEAWSTSSSIGMIARRFDHRTSLVIDPPDGRIPAETPGGARRQTALAGGWNRKAGPEDFDNNHRCLTTGVPRLGGNFGAGPYSFYQIVQTPDHVVFLMEAFHDARVIPLDGRPPVAAQVRQWNGVSRGRWDGDTLVVETDHFSSKSFFRGAAEGLHLVERFTRTGPDTLTYRMTFTDPTTWTASWTAETPLHRSPQAVYEYACHEGNVSIVGMLRTARLEDGGGAVGASRPE